MSNSCQESSSDSSVGCRVPIMLRSRHISSFRGIVDYYMHESSDSNAVAAEVYEEIVKELVRYQSLASATDPIPVPLMLSESQIQFALSAHYTALNDNEDAFSLANEDVLEALQRASLVDPLLDRDKARDWFRDLIGAGTSDIQSEADVAKAIVNSLVEAAPASTITAVMHQWLERARDNEGGVFDAIHAFQPECDEDQSLIQQAERILSR